MRKACLQASKYMEKNIQPFKVSDSMENTSVHDFYNSIDNVAQLGGWMDEIEGMNHTMLDDRFDISFHWVSPLNLSWTINLLRQQLVWDIITSIQPFSIGSLLASSKILENIYEKISIDYNDNWLIYEAKTTANKTDAGSVADPRGGGWGGSHPPSSKSKMPKIQHYGNHYFIFAPSSPLTFFPASGPAVIRFITNINTSPPVYQFYYSFYFLWHNLGPGRRYP